ncbi:MAG TPA: TonB-dependent receptor, partial [Hyphomonas sp.]|nr:TonB-dependent receptor [Hyphomonas sp.]
MFYKTALLGAVAFGFTVSATAQTASIEETKLDTIIVNGSRLDQTMTEIGSSVSVITRDDLEELGVDSALDAIAT